MLILNVITLGLLITRKPSWIVWLLLAAWPEGWFVMAAMPYAKWIINLPTLILTLGAALALLRPTFEKTQPEPGA